MNALPPPDILAYLTGPTTACVIQYQRSNAEAGDVTSVRCGGRGRVIARSYHGDSVRRVNGCAVMVRVDGVRFARLFQVSNCGGALRVREVGREWTQALLAVGRIAPARLEGVLYTAVPQRPSCYRVSILFTPLGKTTNSPFAERSVIRCGGAETRNTIPT